MPVEAHMVLACFLVTLLPATFALCPARCNVFEMCLENTRRLLCRPSSSRVLWGVPQALGCLVVMPLCNGSHLQMAPVKLLLVLL